MRKVTIDGRTHLILREAKPGRSPKSTHECVVYHGQLGARKDVGAIIQCDCGKRYRARIHLMDNDYCVWVRRILPWPPKVENWPRDLTDPTYD